MVLLYLIGFVAGLIAGISPCILPVLPVILVAGTTGASRGALKDGATTEGEAEGAIVTTRRSYRAYAVIAGLVVSFSIFTLAGSALLSALRPPPGLPARRRSRRPRRRGRRAHLPPLGHLLERPFARWPGTSPPATAGRSCSDSGSGCSSCPAPVPYWRPSAVVGANHDVGLASVVLTVDFAAGAAVPLLIFALAGQRVGDRVAAFRTHAALARQIGGVVLLVMTLLIAFNVTDGPAAMSPDTRAPSRATSRAARTPAAAGSR